MSFRNLVQLEIDQLENQGCRAENWMDVVVDSQLDIRAIEYVRFAGKIKIAAGVQLRNVGLLQNYEIEKDVHIENISSLITVGETSFGNGVKIHVLNEGGGRELMIYDTLSSQIAYMLVCYRYEKSLIAALEEMIVRYSARKKSTIGVVSQGSLILNSRTIKNVSIGPYSVIDNSTLLEEGTILSNREAPVIIGEGVIAKNFIVQSGSRINEGALISHCFVGQAVQIGKQFSGDHSVFFANSEAYHSEACSIFAGPYTVTHHRSTLLIAGMFSFYNAGSGTNQSNHMYKLGPLHQGIVERGAKTGSYSYMIWPSFVSAYSVIIGKHQANFDISDFPFSYLTEEDGKSMLAPAMNLFTVGTKRDSQKWPARDRRGDSRKYDLINFELFNPYIVSRVLKAKEKLTELSEKTTRDKALVSYKGVYIKRLILKPAIKYYELILNCYIGHELMDQIELYHDLSFADFKRKIVMKDASLQEWYDFSGMFIPAESRRKLIQSIQSGEIQDLQELSNELQAIFMNYKRDSWKWCTALIELRLGKTISELTTKDFIDLLEGWKNSALKLNNLTIHDVQKEFGPVSMIGYGLDGSSEDRLRDFEAVRGKLDSDSFTCRLQEESESILLKFEKFSGMILKN